MRFNENKNILIQSFKKSVGNKTMNVTLEVPALMGSADSGFIGGVVVNESIDDIRNKWKKGYNVKGGKAKKHPYLDDNRAINRAFLTGEPTPGYEFTESLLKRKDLQKRKKNLSNHYKKKKKQFKKLTGLKKVMYKTRYLPNPQNPPLYDSGLMIDSLSAVIKKKVKTKLGYKNCDFQFDVDPQREQAANLQGGLNSGSNNKILSNLESGKYKESKKLFRNFIFWGDDNRTKGIYEEIKRKTIDKISRAL